MSCCVRITILVVCIILFVCDVDTGCVCSLNEHYITMSADVGRVAK